MAISSPLGKLFGISPVRPVQEHMQVAEETVQLLQQLIEAANDGNAERVSEICRAIETAAASARVLQRNIRRHLPRSLLLAMPRPDLINLVRVQSKIPAAARRVARRVDHRQLTFPGTSARSVAALARRTAKTVEQALLAISEIDELVEVGFSGPEVRRVESLLDKLDDMAARCAEQAATAHRQLKRQEAQISAVDAIFCADVVDGLEHIADLASAVGEHLHLLMAH